MVSARDTAVNAEEEEELLAALPGEWQYRVSARTVCPVSLCCCRVR